MRATTHYQGFEYATSMTTATAKVSSSKKNVKLQKTRVEIQNNMSLSLKNGYICIIIRN